MERRASTLLVLDWFLLGAALSLAACRDEGQGPGPCDDGIFCNGTERLVNGRCEGGFDPCNDGSDCTADACDEATRTCSHALGDAACATCLDSCVPDCSGRACGDDGCGGSCGSCGAGEGCASITGQCAPTDQAGTCGNPLPLLAMGEPLLGTHVVAGDTSTGLHETTPTCNATSTAVELVYAFTVTERVGLDARVSGYDTVLSVRSACADDGQAATVGCTDDSSPPGDYGSRVAVALDPGDYVIVVDGFDQTQYGPFTLTATFLPDGCVPACDGRYCGGDDGCGGSCGECGEGLACNAENRCEPNPCVPACDGRECGDDGCGGSCGTCTGEELCVPADGQCKAFTVCDHDDPVCEGGCGDDELCGTDCTCYGLDQPLPDLVLDVERLGAEILFDTVSVAEGSCALAEECVGGVGERRVMRFSVEAINQGFADLVVPPPPERPDLFEFSPCHGHYHFSGFAEYALLDTAGEVVLTGRKQAYCMEDTEQVVQGPDVPCAKRYTCDDQGIQRGWGDLYGNTLDCQWLDITGLPPGEYRLEVSLNPGRNFQEGSFDNNIGSVPVTIAAE